MSAPWEPSSWMREQIDRRKVQIALTGLLQSGADVITPLTDDWSIGTADAREDRTCDRCRTFDPAGVWAGVVELNTVVGPRLLLVVGLCDHCYDAEGSPAARERVEA